MYYYGNNYNGNDYYYDYNYGINRPPSQQPQTSASFVAPGAIIKELNVSGHQGHCFKSTWAGKEHTFNLVSFDNLTGMVSIIENGAPKSVHFSDMIGLDYQGPICPTSGQSQGPGPGSGQNCGWVWHHHHWKWMCI